MRSENNVNIKERNIILFIISAISILGLFILNKQNIYNYIFALVYLVIIYKSFNESNKKSFYYITLLFAIMSITLGIRLKKYIGIDEQLNIYYVYLLIYIIGFIAKAIKEKKKIFQINFVNVSFAIFALYTFLSFFIAKDKKIAIIELIYYGIMFCLVIMIVNENRSKRDILQTLKFLGIVSLGMVIMGLFKIVTGIQLEPNSSYLPLGAPLSSIQPPFNRIPTLFFYNPNNYALVAVIVLIAFSILFISNTKYNKWLILLAIAIVEINVFFTRSRTGWIATIISLVFISLVLLLRKKWKKAILTLVPIFMFCILFTGMESIKNASFLYDKLGELEEHVDENGEVVDGPQISIGSTGSINVRATLYVDILEGVFKEKNYLGFGAGNINEYIKMRDNTHGRYDPHCWWLEILGDFGIVGFVSFTLGYFLLAFKLFIDFLKGSELRYISLLCLALLAVMSMLVISPSSVLRITPFWIVIALSLSTSDLISDRSN